MVEIAKIHPWYKIRICKEIHAYKNDFIYNKVSITNNEGNDKLFYTL